MEFSTDIVKRKYIKNIVLQWMTLILKEAMYVRGQGYMGSICTFTSAVNPKVL